VLEIQRACVAAKLANMKVGNPAFNSADFHDGMIAPSQAGNERKQQASDSHVFAMDGAGANFLAPQGLAQSLRTVRMTISGYFLLRRKVVFQISNNTFHILPYKV